jgi:hypothetical protein
VDLLNIPLIRRWPRWQIEVKQPDGRNMPFDDAHGDMEGFPHALLANALFRDAAEQRWAHDRAPATRAEWNTEAFLFFDDRVRPRPPQVPCCRTLDRSGAAVFRSGWGREATMGLLLARPLMPFGTDQVNTAHRHDDPLNLLVHAFGELLAIDPGYGPGYLADLRYSWYLAPEAHNVILVDNQGLPRSTAYEGDCLRANVSQSSGRVSEVCRLPGLYGALAETSYRGVDCRRRVFFARRRYFVIVDEVESPRTHEYALLLHGGSDDFEYLGDGGVWRVGGARLLARVLLPSGLAVKQVRGHGVGRKGSPDDRHVYIRGITAGRDVRFVTLLVPDRWDAERPRIALLNHEPLALGVRVAGRRTWDAFVWNPKRRRCAIPLPGGGRFTTGPAAEVRALSVAGLQDGRDLT